MIHAGASAAGEPGVPPEDCRAQLDRILKSPDFEATGREHRFLSHVVQEALAGRGDRIKAYSIAVEVFGRDSSFDPQNDPIVRIEAGHLRRSLERYYLTAGQSDPIVITIPKGGYVPIFEQRARPEALGTVVPTAPAKKEPAAPGWMKPSWMMVAVAAVIGALTVVAFKTQPAGVTPATPEIPRLLVERFDDLTGTEASAAIASGLTEEIVGQLSKFKDLVVVEAVDKGASTPRPRFMLAGSVNLSPDAFRLRVRFVNQDDGSVLWANSYDGDMKVAALVGAQGDIAKNVVTSLAQTYGVIFQADATLNVANPPDDWAAYSCTLSYYAYRVGVDREALPAVRACLEKAVERFPTYATAWALLAQVQMDEIRFQFPYDPATSQPAMEQALAMARRAVELDPLNIRGLQAEMFGLFLTKQFEAARSVGEHALALNPNDTELMGEFGYRLALSGNWVDGCPLVAEARDRNPGPFAYYESALALCSYFKGDQAQAVMWIRKTTAPKNAFFHLIAAAIFGEAGLKLDAERDLAWVAENRPELLSNVRQEIEIRLGRPEDAEFFLGSLKKAGLDVPS